MQLKQDISLERNVAPFSDETTRYRLSGRDFSRQFYHVYKSRLTAAQARLRSAAADKWREYGYREQALLNGAGNDLLFLQHIHTAHWLVTLFIWSQGCGVGVTWSRGNEPGVGVGLNLTASTPTPERFV